MIKIAIIGSRGYEDYIEFKTFLSKEIKSIGISEWQLISGGAKGVDSMADEYYRSCAVTNLPPIIIRPDYKNNPPKIAPLIRNRQIAKECDLMIAFWDGLSGGTANAIAWATIYGKRVVIFEV